MKKKWKNNQGITDESKSMITVRSEDNVNLNWQRSFYASVEQWVNTAILQQGISYPEYLNIKSNNNTDILTSP